ncbi:MAG: AAA family ATPase [Chloroflexi bacterium]|nr:AAA family ATPase [Chloroflexota bacterium]
MHIETLVVKNFRCLNDVEIDFNRELNVIVGNNETGKTTILEAINLALTCQIHGRNIRNELHPFLFNIAATDQYLRSLFTEKPQVPPSILIELYFNDQPEIAKLKGTNNSKRKDCPGVFIDIRLNKDCSQEYREYISNPSEVKSIPVEYYEVSWSSFANEFITWRSIGLKSLYIDTVRQRSSLGTNRHVVEFMRTFLSPKDLAEISLSYRGLRDGFANAPLIQSINELLRDTKGDITEKELTVALDVLTKNGWETDVAPHVDAVPVALVGKGEQSAIKLKLAMKKASENAVFLIEEPENHLTYSNLNKLISSVRDKASGKQLIVVTHSSFVLNKLGIHNVILFDGSNVTTIQDLRQGDQDYFMKLPGYDTLRLILSKRAILVEGPSDELIVQKAFLQQYGKLPLDCGVDVITVASLAFDRFLEIAKRMKIPTVVVRDNDAKVASLDKKYEVYSSLSHINILYDRNEEYPSLEQQLLRVNGRCKLNQLLQRRFEDDLRLLNYMKDNKTECALRLFNSKEDVTIPEYIKRAVSNE